MIIVLHWSWNSQSFNYTLVYATGGNELLMEAVFVDIVSRVVTPRATLAGTALGSIQKENLQINKFCESVEVATQGIILYVHFIF